jgi:hypothetical protein
MLEGNRIIAKKELLIVGGIIIIIGLAVLLWGVNQMDKYEWIRVINDDYQQRYEMGTIGAFAGVIMLFVGGGYLRRRTCQKCCEACANSI